MAAQRKSGEEVRELTTPGKVAVGVVVEVEHPTDRLRRSPKWAAVAAEVVVVWREGWKETAWWSEGESVSVSVSGSRTWSEGVTVALNESSGELACEGPRSKGNSMRSTKGMIAWRNSREARARDQAEAHSAGAPRQARG